MNTFKFIDDEGAVLYWRGPEETVEQACSAIQAEGFFVAFIERLK